MEKLTFDVKGIPITMCPIPAGSFMMGQKKNQHKEKKHLKLCLTNLMLIHPRLTEDIKTMPKMATKKMLLCIDVYSSSLTLHQQ